MKTLVTGAAGLIGSHLVRSLLDKGREVVITDNFSRGGQQNLNDLGIKNKCLAVDLRYFDQALKLTKDVDTVFHLAAKVGSVDFLHGSYAKELDAMLVNTAIDTNVISACVDNKVKKIIYASSVSVYPINTQHVDNVVLKEDDLRISDKVQGEIDPEGGYGWAKFISEVQLALMTETKVGIARIFNTYGDNAALGKSSHVVQALITKAVRYPKEEFIVWGDGKQTRDFLYVEDCVNALLKLEEKASIPPVVVNIGSDKEVSIGTLAEKIVKISGKTIKIKYDVSKPVGPTSRSPDTHKIRKTLGWKDTYTLEEGLKNTYKWVEKRLNEENTLDGES
jgi:nucleoside-diphosphate-sugar epimerase